MRPPTVIRTPHEDCWACGRKVNGPYFGTPSISETRYGKEIFLHQLCRICFEMDYAIQEAEANNVRFTNIGVGWGGIRSHNGMRCACGAVTHTWLERCVPCSKTWRMLNKQEAEAKIFDKLLKTMRQEIKFIRLESTHAPQ